MAANPIDVRTDRLTVLYSYAVMPNVSKAAEAACIPYATAHGWIEAAKRSGELDDYIEGLKQVRLSQLNEILELSGSALLDRLKHGDTIIQDGVIHKVPVKGRDLAAIRQSIAAEVSVLAQTAKPLDRQDANLLAIASELEGYIKAKAENLTRAPMADVSSLLGSDVAKLIKNQDASRANLDAPSVEPAVKTDGQGGNAVTVKSHISPSQILQTPEGLQIASAGSSEGGTA